MSIEIIVALIGAIATITAEVIRGFTKDNTVDDTAQKFCPDSDLDLPVVMIVQTDDEDDYYDVESDYYDAESDYYDAESDYYISKY
jgi:hypothetical protein